jgi:hypothetical protein
VKTNLIQTSLLAATLLALPAAAQAQTTFTQITNGAIVSDQGNWIGSAWGDYHNSGFLDLVTVNLFGTLQ